MKSRFFSSFFIINSCIIKTGKVGYWHNRIRTKLTHIMSPKWLLTISILMWGATMNACAADTMTWKEEVLLHDGSKIIVEREVKRGGRHEIGQQPPIKEQSLAFTLPTTNERLVWKSEYSKDVRLADFQPLLLDIFQGTVYVVTLPVGCLSYNKWGRPNPPYVVFKYQGTEWQRITLQELPAQFKTPNLIISSPDNEVKKMGKSFVTAAMVQRANSDLSQSEFKNILREVVKRGQGVTSCEEMIRVKDGWVSPGGAKAPIPITPHTPSDVKK